MSLRKYGRYWARKRLVVLTQNEPANGFDHRVGHCGVLHGRASMNLYVPLGGSPEIGRTRPYQIGGHAHTK
jgi:hypothetical protein